MWPIRSALFVPAHRRDWVAKAIRVSPGAVVLDIEDSVPPQFKPQAMAHLKSEIHELRDAGVGAFVRIQPLYDGTAAEIEAAVTDGLTAIVLPKVATAGRNPPAARSAELCRGPGWRRAWQRRHRAAAGDRAGHVRRLPSGQGQSPGARHPRRAERPGVRRFRPRLRLPRDDGRRGATVSGIQAGAGQPSRRGRCIRWRAFSARHRTTWRRWSG